MFMRIVEAEVKQGNEPALESVYEDYVIPSLEKSDGCLFAGLLQSVDRFSCYASLTLWESEQKIRDYINSGTYEKNLEQIRPWLETSSEWKIQLTKEDTLEYAPVSQVPAVKSYPIEPGIEFLSKRVPSNRSYLRVLSLQVRPGREKEFKKIYKEEIQKELQKTPGCRYSFLVDNTGNDNEMISITIWDDLESVTVYEQQGKFRSLLDKLKHTLAELYQWKMALNNQPESTASVTSQDIDISKFTLVVGKKFK